MAQIIFDIPLNLLIGLQGREGIDSHDIRVCIPPDTHQVKRAHDLGCRYIKVSFDPVILQDLSPFMEILAEAEKRGLKATFSCINIAQYALGTMVALRKLINNERALAGIIIDDPGSRLDPLFTYGTLSKLQQTISCPIEYHGRNTLELAMGNVLGAIRSGVRKLAVSIGGIGGISGL
jgi:homocitrate synthase NifV